MQMIDPSLDGPADPEALKIFAALNTLGVIAVRPILLAIAGTHDSLDAMRFILKLIVRRIVVGNLATGSIERRFGDAAKEVHDSTDWHILKRKLADLNPSRDEFINQLQKRSFNKGTLAFLRRSIIWKSTTPDKEGVLHFIMPRQQTIWDNFSEEDALYWGSKIPNTFLSKLERRPKEAISWEGFKQSILNNSVEGEWGDKLRSIDVWNATTMEEIGAHFAEVAADVWF
jgi:hypothetical protein